MSPLMRSLLLSLALFVLPFTAKAADVFVSVRVGPPPLPVYEQPWAPAPGYLWMPGYWAWDDWNEDYYWVPGTWVRPPRVGVLWTPGYWAWNAGYYNWYPGYWGPRVGYYGGINYGFGYTGHGYHGGYWRDNHFWYNSYVNRVRGDNARYSYRKSVTHITVNHVSYNGGDGGTRARPSRQDENDRRQQHVRATEEQSRHERAARQDRGLRLSENRGRPATLALPTASRFSRDRDERNERDRDERDRDRRAGSPRRGTDIDSDRRQDQGRERRAQSEQNATRSREARPGPDARSNDRGDRPDGHAGERRARPERGAAAPDRRPERSPPANERQRVENRNSGRANDERRAPTRESRSGEGRGVPRPQAPPSREIQRERPDRVQAPQARPERQQRAPRPQEGSRPERGHNGNGNNR